ncbi:MAG: alternative ribosome rescue aminoacyl-tRNA hydrolase ArfB [Trueperaceae bacterium]
MTFPNGSSIDEAELEFRASRSGGPGGQGVNTTSSKVELRWDVGASSLSNAQKQRVRERLGNRITTDDVLILQSAEERSQHQNRDAAVARFRALVGEAIQPPKKRRKTRVSRSQKRQRLEDKRHRSEKKRLRRTPKRRR